MIPVDPMEDQLKQLMASLPQPATPMGGSGTPNQPGQSADPNAQPDQSGYVVPAHPDLLAQDARTPGMTLARRRLSPAMGKRRF